MFIKKDYQLNNGVLFKTGLVEAKHLMWSLGGVPCVDADLWDAFNDRTDRIEFHTNKQRTFSVDKETFEVNKKVLDKGFGRQYYIDKDKWTIK